MLTAQGFTTNVHRCCGLVGVMVAFLGRNALAPSTGMGTNTLGADGRMDGKQQVASSWPNHQHCPILASKPQTRSRQARTNERFLQAKDHTNLLEEAKPVAPDQNRPEQTCRWQLGQLGKAERQCQPAGEPADLAGGDRRVPYWILKRLETA